MYHTFDIICLNPKEEGGCFVEDLSDRYHAETNIKSS